MAKSRFKISTKMLVLLIILIVLIIVSTIITGGQFVAITNLRNILQTTTTVSLLTIGAATLMISGQIDLSLGASGTFGAVVCAYFLTAGLPWIVGLVGGIVAAGLFGLLNSVLVMNLHLPSFITTIATAYVAQGCCAIVCSGVQITVKDNVILTLGGGRIGGFFPISLVISLLLLLIYGIMLRRTAFGRSIYIVGSNAEASRLCGLHPRRVTYILFINGACLAGLCGILVSGRLSYANTGTITGSQFDGITAAILGGVGVGGGTGGMGGALLGILLLNCFNNLMTLMGINPHWQDVAAGLLLLVALGADYITTRSRLRS